MVPFLSFLDGEIPIFHHQQGRRNHFSGLNGFWPSLMSVMLWCDIIPACAKQQGRNGIFTIGSAISGRLPGYSDPKPTEPMMFRPKYTQTSYWSFRYCHASRSTSQSMWTPAFGHRIHRIWNSRDAVLFTPQCQPSSWQASEKLKRSLCSLWPNSFPKTKDVASPGNKLRKHGCPPAMLVDVPHLWAMTINVSSMKSGG